MSYQGFIKNFKLIKNNKTAMLEQENYEEIKNLYIEHVKELITDLGELYPHITVFATGLSDSNAELSIIHIPMPEEMSNTPDGEKEFYQEMIPEIFKEIKKKFKPYGVGNIEIKPNTVDLNLDFGEIQEVITFEISKKGMKITEYGLTNTISLENMKTSVPKKGSLKLFNYFKKK